MQGVIVMALCGLPAAALAQARTIWGTSYTPIGTAPARGFQVTLPNTTASTTASFTGCQAGILTPSISNTSAVITGTNSGTVGFYAPAIPAGTTGIGTNINRNAAAAGCAAGTAIVWNQTMTFTTAVDPQALRFHWLNLDSGTYVFGAGVVPGFLAGNNIFDVVGQNVNSAALSAVNEGCQANNGTNPTASCGSVNFSAATATITTLRYGARDSDGSTGNGDGHVLALSLNQPSLLIRKRTTDGTGSTSFTFNYPSNVVTNAAAGDVAATTETIAVAANNTFVNGQQRYIANSGLDTAITEPVPAGWRLSAAQCVDEANGNAVVATLAAPVTGPANATLTLTAANVTPTAQIRCDFTNARQIADLSITKTNTFAQGASDLAADTVARGPTTYTLVVSNAGPVAVVGAVVRDAPVAGVTCPPGNPVTITGSGVPAGTFTVADLTGSTGIVLGTLAVGQSTTLTFQCTVN
ncbi:MAG: DUF11 domain-containing protein [Lysobacter sp.]|nr:DUF11 domain-containing protein [Lysobacter sp.]